VRTLAKLPAPASSRNIPGKAAVPISSAKPPATMRSARKRQKRGSSSKKRASDPPTMYRPSAPMPSLAIHLIVAPAATVPRAPVPSPAALSRDDVTSELPIQPVTWQGMVQSW
jgi:hypothetical protein